MDKKAFRLAMGARKAALSESEIARRSARLAEKLFATEAYRRADALFAYISFNREVLTAPIIRRAWSDGKRVAVPKVVGDGIRFIRIDRLDDLAPGAFGIPEPVADGVLRDGLQGQGGQQEIPAGYVIFDLQGVLKPDLFQI